MPQIDMEPGDYRQKGRREPILHANWKTGVFSIILAVLILVLFAKPLWQWLYDTSKVIWPS